MTTLTKVMATAIAAGMLAPIAFADNSSRGSGDDGISVDANVGVQVRASSTDRSRGDDSMEQGDDNMSATGTMMRDDHSTTTGKEMREEHRSEVAERVQELLQVADRAGGIGSEVRDIAHDIASSSERQDEAKTSVENRPGWLVFIIGSDYGNLGKLRSEISTTQNQIERLTNAMNRATDASVKADLQAQIDALQVQASTTNAFVKDNESNFSIFGWFFKLFS